MEEHERVGLRESPRARDDLVSGLARPDVSQVLSSVWRERSLDGVNGSCGGVSGVHLYRTGGGERTGLLEEPVNLVLSDEVVFCWLKAEPAHYACVVGSRVQEIEGQQMRLRAIARLAWLRMDV